LVSVLGYCQDLAEIAQIKVYRYAALVTNAVIPKAFWGSSRNFKFVLGRKYLSIQPAFAFHRIFLKCVDVKKFISCRRYETLTLHHLLQGFSTSDCDWLMAPGQAAQPQFRVTITDALKRRELLEEFIYWYFSSFLLPLLKVCHDGIYMPLYRLNTLFWRQHFISQKHLRFVIKYCISGMMTGRLSVRPWLSV
jgi:telomerase reverse transcriptase